MAKRIMRAFTMHEISAVTMPAQKGAKMVIMKSAETPPAADPAKKGDQPAPLDISKLSDAEMREMIAKGRLRLTTPSAGHSHLLDVDDYAMVQGGGTTRSSGEDGGTPYHSHPYVIAKDGTITIGYASGHTHELMPIPAVKAATEKEDVMTPEQIARMDSLEKLAGMTDAQKAHLAKLSGDDKTAFLDADYAKREEIIKAAAVVKADEDPVVYTAKDGTVYLKSDGAAAVKTAKSMDLVMATVAKVADAGVDAQAEAIAKTDMAHLGMPHAEKVAMAKGILNMPPVARDAQLAALKKTAETLAPIFKAFGSMATTDEVNVERPVDKLDSLAKAAAKESGETYHAAYAKVLKTPEGKQLYAESVGRPN